MIRNKVAPGQTIPASTLAESSGNIAMSKWGNRFVIPYELLTGGQGMRINKLSQMISLDAATESNRQYVELLETLEKGDGVKTAATIEGITTYDGTAGTFGFAAFLIGSTKHSRAFSDQPRYHVERATERVTHQFISS